MEDNIHLQELMERYPQLLPIKNKIAKAAECLIECFQHGRKLLLCGNGGSCSDSEHIAGELMKGFEHKRPLDEKLKKELVSFDPERGSYLSENLQQGLPAISLTVHSVLLTAVANDIDANLIFAQQVVGYGNQGDVLIGISTSGNSQSVVDAIITAKAEGMVVIGLTGETGGKMKSYCDILINVPGRNTAFIQELHIPVYHTLCQIVESSLFGKIQA